MNVRKQQSEFNIDKENFTSIELVLIIVYVIVKDKFIYYTH